jgi:hypothetical protein
MTEKKQQNGGKREGAGRPALEGGGRKTAVRLDEKTIEKAKAVGQGNLSLGLRLIVAAYTPTESTK